MFVNINLSTHKKRFKYRPNLKKGVPSVPEFVRWRRERGSNPQLLDYSSTRRVALKER